MKNSFDYEMGQGRKDWRRDSMDVSGKRQSGSLSSWA